MVRSPSDAHRVDPRRFDSAVVGLESRYCAVATDDPLARRSQFRLADVEDRVIAVDPRTGTTTAELWPHDRSPRKHENAAYDVSGATVNQHAVWWLWPNTCLLRYPGRGNFMVFQVLPAGPDRTLETWDFYFETTELDDAEMQSVRYIDEVLQVQDIGLVESVQRGMGTPAFDQGRIVYDPAGSGLSEHGVHHFHGLVLDAYRSWVDPPTTGADRRSPASSLRS